MGLFSFLRIIFGTATKVRKSRAMAAELGQLPMETFLPKWVECLSQGMDELCPILCPPAKEAEITAAELRLGTPIPDELKDFYRLSNGVRWQEGSSMSNISVLDELRTSSAFIPPLSAQLLAEWEEWGREHEEPRGLRVFANSFADLISDTPERTIPFSEIDSMLALEAPESGQGAVVVVRKNRYFPIGTVLAIEGLQATRFDGIRAWMASNVANLAAVMTPRN
jgi:hypothetical protein